MPEHTPPRVKPPKPFREFVKQYPGVAEAYESLGEAVRADVLAKTGVQLDWEIKRIGRPLS